MTPFNWRSVTLLTVAAAIVTAGAWYVYTEPPYPGIFDADLKRLAETEAEAWCSGFVFGDSSGKGSAKKAAACRDSSTMSTEINHDIVVAAFCEGVRAGGVPIPQSQCESVMDSRGYWPTRDGELSVAFNDQYPRPGETFRASRTDGGDPSRTGNRLEVNR